MSAAAGPHRALRVAVLSGGRSSEHEISLQSGASVADGLRQAGHEVAPVTIERDGRWLAGGEPVRLEPAGGLLGCDAAFPVLHGPFGEDGTVQGLLECLDIPYAGPNVLSAAVALDKLTFKRLCAAHGFPQVGFCEAGEDGWRERAEALGLPLWVKPSRLGSSVGIARVDSLGGLDAAVEAAFAHDPRVIVEQHAGGREVECSAIGNADSGIETSIPGEVVPRGEWYDFDSKYRDGGMDLIVPAPIPERASARVRELAAAAYRAIGNTGLARCDFFVRGGGEDGGEVLLNELNTIPGFTPMSVFAKLFEASGIPYPELCDRLVRLALERYERERSFAF